MYESSKFVSTFLWAISNISPSLNIFPGFKVCFNNAEIKSLWVLILPKSSLPYSDGYVDITPFLSGLLCLNLKTCSAFSPSNFCVPAFKSICRSCVGSSYFISIGTLNSTPPIASTNCINASVFTIT